MASRKKTAKPARKKATRRKSVDTTKKQPVPPWTEEFLEELRDSGSVHHAAAIAGVTRQAAYLARDKHPSFAKAWRSAINKANGSLERSLLQRARDGSDDLQLHEGVPCVDPLSGEKIVRRKHETALGIFMLKKRMPELYGDHAGDGDKGEPLKLPPMNTPAEVREAEGLIVAAYNDGRISGVRYERLLRGVESRRRTIETEDLKADIDELKKGMAQKEGD